MHPDEEDNELDDRQESEHQQTEKDESNLVHFKENDTISKEGRDGQAGTGEVAEEKSKRKYEISRMLEESRKQVEEEKKRRKQVEEEKKRRKQAEEEKKQVEEETQELKKQTEELRKQVEESKKQVEELKKQTEELKKQTEEEKIHLSLKLLFDSTNGSLPELELNTCADEEEQLGEEEEDFNNKSKSKRTHIAADIKDIVPPIENSMKNFNINLIADDGHYVKSYLAKRMKNKKKLINFNEASISLYVMDTLNDVLECLHLDSDTAVGKEISIFSMRPDIVVVRWLTRIILVVEVKNPGKDGRKVVSNKIAAGQAFDYAMGMHQMGIDHPFVCLSTYDYMLIGTLKESSDDIFTEARSILEKGSIPKIDGESGKPKPQPSPEKLGNLIEIPDDSKQGGSADEQDENKPSAEKLGSLIEIPDDSKKDGSADEQDKNKVVNEDDSTIKREIYLSKTFDRTNIFKALYFIITCGVISAEKSTNCQNQNLVPKEGEQIERLTAVVTETSFQWTKLRCKATYRLNGNQSNVKKVYLLCVLGQGCSGKVYLGSHPNGQMFAVKLYLFDSQIMESFRAEDNQKHKELQEIKAKNTRQKEYEKWILLYPKYETAIVASVLNGVPSLAMPYVAPIPANKRKSLVKEVEKELKRFAQAGYAYRETDLRWRHIGLRKGEDGKEQVVLVDLESLENISLETDGLARVHEQIKELKKRAKGESVTVAQDFIHPS